MAHAAPVAKDGFSFADGDFYVEVSNHNRYRRAAVVELRALLHGSSDSNPVAHWWEAQCVHYGLAPSKTKAVAKTRLLDALNREQLAVPPNLVKLEGDLKKEWNKKERQAKAETKKTLGEAKPAANSSTTESSTTVTTFTSKSTSTTTTRTTTTASTSSKRKNTSDAAGAKPTPSKKARPADSKATTSKPKATAAQAAAPKPAKSEASTSKPKATAARAAAPKPAKSAASVSKPIPPNQSRPKTTVSRPRQTAIKSFPPRREMPNDFDGDDVSDGYDTSSDGDDPPPDYDTAMQETAQASSPRLGRLGFLNGTYDIECPDLEDWGYNSSDFSLILTVEGDSLWGAYDFGMFEGIIRLPRRPHRASDERLELTWRGHENGEGVMSFGSGNHGWLQFHGDGEISGMINCYGRATFEARKIGGGQKSSRSAQSMRQEWNNYNQREYDRANRARWGGSGW